MSSLLVPGAVAPDFTLPDQTGTEHTLEQYRGRWVVLYFYPKDDTPGCTQEACSFRDSLTEVTQLAQVLGVNADSVESHAKFAKKYSLNFPLLADPEKVAIKAYGASGLLGTSRVTFLIDPQGKIAKVYPDVNVSAHAAGVLGDLGALAKGERATPAAV